MGTDDLFNDPVLQACMEVEAAMKLKARFRIKRWSKPPRVPAPACLAEAPGAIAEVNDNNDCNNHC